MPSPRQLLGPLCLLPVLLGSCSEVAFEPVNPRPLDPPGIYRSWWAEVEACADVRAAFERVSWYEADRLINREAGTEHVGAWWPPHTIYVDSGYLLFEGGVKHEMLHDLLQTRDHSSPLFTRCAGV